MNAHHALPLLLAALTLGCTAPAAHAAQQLATLVQIDATDYEHAKCNDGTQATYYLRGTGPDGAVSGRKWLIFLHGGGSCTSDEACAERWYDRDAGSDGIIGFHGNMTASTAPTHNFNGEGILDFDGVDGLGDPGTNPFAGFNRVMIPYCSSDTYTGRNTTARTVDYASYIGTTVTVGGQTVTITNPGNVIPPLTAIRFSGRFIVEAVVDLLMRGGIRSGKRPRAGTADDADPPASASDEIVISGSSAGGSGVIRNLDNLARIVRDAAAPVQVFGVIDAADAVGIVPDAAITGDGDHAVASFYQATGSDEADLSCQAVHPLATSPICFSPTFVLKHFVETPHFVVQQSYDGVIHGGLKETIAQGLSATAPPGLADTLAVQYIRNRISLGALELGGGVADPQHVGFFVPNYASSKHQLMAEDTWFFNSPLSKHGGNDPRLGSDPQSTLGLPRALACFRFKVSGQGGGCVDAGDARVVSATYPTNPLLATYEASTSTLTLPYVRLSDGRYFGAVSVTLDPLGTVLVGDPAVPGPGSLAEYDAAANVLQLPWVSAGGALYERVSVSGAGIRVLGFEPLALQAARGAPAAAAPARR